MTTPGRWKLAIWDTGRVTVSGIQTGDMALQSCTPNKTLTAQYIAVREAGSHYWAERGRQGYAPASIRIFMRLVDEPGWWLPVLQFPIQPRAVTPAEDGGIARTVTDNV